MSTLLELRQVSKTFRHPLDVSTRIANLAGRAFGADPKREQVCRAVDRVDLKIGQGKVVGLVGESGCGKSTVGRMAVGLHQPTAGERIWRGTSLDAINSRERRAIQLRMQMIFQDPYASLNPRKTVLDIVGEAPVVHGMVPARQQEEFVSGLLEKVGLPGTFLRRYPHQFSGGQRARVGIARALAVNPELLVCDESVAALDVSIQAQVLNLFMKLRQDLGLTYLFISHDLSVIRHISDEVVVMYLGRVVEQAPAEAFFQQQFHPYSQALLRAAPTVGSGKKQFRPISGEIPSPLNPPGGCHFHPRCPHAMPKCATQAPELRIVSMGRLSACHLNA
ncbi:MAG: ATP-binding cassette domain-containing protein [Burkholderiales bacterium]|nr:ATP-binding cassette domain-containing protein [Burkholderiales bacterium]